MPSDRSDRAPLPIGPSGNLLTLEDLPPSDTVRWVIRRKAELVAAIRGGLLSLEDACERYRLSEEESLCLGLTRSPGTGLVACAPLSCSFTESPTETEQGLP